MLDPTEAAASSTVKANMVIITQLVLLLCACCVQTQDVMAPSVNIVHEIGKIKNLEERLKTTEEVMQNQNNQVTELSSKLEELRSENGVLNTTVQTFQDKVQTLQIQNEVQKTTIQTLQDQVQTLQNLNEVQKTKVQNLQDEVQTLQNENKARKVAFSASLLAFGAGHEGPHSSVTSPLIYKKVFTNIGNGYNSNTGIFTAPVKGVYYFRFYAHCHIGTKMAVSLYKDGKIQCSVFSLKPVSNGNANNGIVLTLEKGDQIYTRLWDNAWVYDDDNSYTSFGGFLLFPL